MRSVNNFGVLFARVPRLVLLDGLSLPLLGHPSGFEKNLLKNEWFAKVCFARFVVNFKVVVVPRAC